MLSRPSSPMENDSFLPSPFSLHSDTLRSFRNNNFLIWETTSREERLWTSPPLCGGTQLQPSTWEYDQHLVLFFYTERKPFWPVWKQFIQLIKSCFGPLKTAWTYFHSNCLPTNWSNKKSFGLSADSLWPNYCTYLLLFAVVYVCFPIKTRLGQEY